MPTDPNQLIVAIGSVEITAAAGDGPPQVSIIAYNGGIIRPDGFGAVVIELGGLEIPSTLKLLADHRATIDGIVGQGSPKIVNGRLIVAGSISTANDAGRQVLQLNADGIDLAASVGIRTLTSLFIPAGETIEANGRTVTAPRGGMLHVTAGQLLETSIVAIGADTNSSVHIAATREANNMPYNNPPNDNDGNNSNETPDVIRAAERSRLKAIDELCNNMGELSDGHQQRLDELRAQAVDGEIELPSLQASALQIMRDNRPSAPQSYRTADTGTSRQVIEAALLCRAGLESLAEKELGPRVMEQMGHLRSASLVDLCAASLQIDGLDRPSDRDEMIRAGFSGGTLTVALGNAANKSLLQAYLEAPATWRSWATPRSAANFKDNTSLRPSFVGELAEVPAGGGIDHGNVNESTFTWSIDTFAKMYRFDRRDVINDDLHVLDETGPALGRAALRKLNDLVYSTLMANAGNHYAAGNNNLLTGGSSALDLTALGDAVQKIRQQRDSENNDLDIVPRTLVVAPENEVTAKNILESIEVNKTGDNSPTGNALRNVVNLEIEPRLSNTAKFSDASTTAWYVFASPADVALIVGFLNGRMTPIVEFFGLQAEVDHLAVAWRVFHDFGAALGDFRASVKADGA